MNIYIEDDSEIKFHYFVSVLFFNHCISQAIYYS